MAFTEISFFSEVLSLSCQANVILPQRPAPYDDLPVLWLLHGTGDDHTIWTRFTSLERYASAYRLAVVMPAVQISYYTDMASGGRYFDFIAGELPEIMRSFFRFSSRREDNFAAGLSMGGYGAFKLAFTRPHQYAACASLSGVLDLAAHVARRTHTPDPAFNAHWQRVFSLIFDDLENLRGSPYDLYSMLDAALAQNVPLPRLYQTCGTEDFLYADNLAFRDHARQLGIDLTYHEASGDHSWAYWDKTIQHVLAWLPLR